MLYEGMGTMRPFCLHAGARHARVKWPPSRFPRVRFCWLRFRKMSKRGPNEPSTSSGPSAKKTKSDHVHEMGPVSGQEEFDLKVMGSHCYRGADITVLLLRR